MPNEMKKAVAISFEKALQSRAVARSDPQLKGLGTRFGDREHLSPSVHHPSSLRTAAAEFPTLSMALRNSSFETRKCFVQ